MTKFAHIHFPASSDALERIIRLGERPEHVHLVGCPRIDLVAEILAQDNEVGGDIFREGVGPSFSLDGPFLLVSQHPVTTEYGTGEEQITATLEATEQIGLPAIVLWPNADAVSKTLPAACASGANTAARGICISSRICRSTPTCGCCDAPRAWSAIRRVGSGKGVYRDPCRQRRLAPERSKRGHNVLDVAPDRGSIKDGLCASDRSWTLCDGCDLR